MTMLPVKTYQDIAQYPTPSDIDAITTEGYYVFGDGGAARYQRVASQPSTIGWAQSATGAYFDIRVSGAHDVRQYGAKGDGVTDDTATIQGVINKVNSLSGGEVFLPPGSYKTTSTLYVLGNVILHGSGFASKIVASNVVGPAVIVGNASGTAQYLAHARDFNISGTATEGLRVYQSILSGVRGVTLSGLTCTNGFVFSWTWNSSFDDLSTNGATVSNACFIAAGAYNANSANNWATSNFCPINVLLDQAFGTPGLSAANSWGTMTVQGGNIGLFAKNHTGVSIGTLYEENTSLPVQFGDSTVSGAVAINCVIHGGVSIGPYANHPNWNNRLGLIHFDNAQGCILDGVNLNGVSSIFPVTLTGGSGSGAVVLARVNATGNVHSYEVLYGGSGYTSAPTASVPVGTGEIPTVAISNGAVISVTKGTGGSGYVQTGGCPVAIVGKKAKRCSVRNGYGANGAYPIYPYFVRAAGADSNLSIAIEEDSSMLYNGDYSTARVAKNGGYAYAYAIHQTDANGNPLIYSYTPPQFP